MARRGGAEIIGVRIHPAVKKLLEERARWLWEMGVIEKPTLSELVRIFIFKGLKELEEVRRALGDEGI